MNLPGRTHQVGRIELKELVDHVAEQLLAAEQQAQNRAGRVMQFTECELEMAISIETGAQGGVRVWVLELGGSRKKTDSNTIKVKFRSLREMAFPGEEEGEGPKLGRSGGF